MATQDRKEEESSGKKASSRKRHAMLETVLFSGGVVVFLVLLYVMAVSEAGRFLSPPRVAVAGTLMLWPLREQQAVRALFVAGGFLLLMWFFDQLSGILLPFLVVYLLAYLFNPLVAALEKRFKVPRWVSSLITSTLAVGLVALIIFLLVPNLVGELKTLATRILDNLNRLTEWFAATTILDQLEATGLVNKNEVTQRLTTFVQQQAETLASGIPDAAQGVVRSIGSLLGLITMISITPVLLFYMLKDYPTIQDRLINLFPTFGGRRDYLMRAGSIVGNYLRGQLMISAIAAFNVAVILLIFDVPFALLIGLLAGLLNMIPNIGIIITYVIGGLIALVFGDPWYIDGLIILAALFGESLLEQSVLTPNILGRQVGLHPVLILFSLFAFGSMMGIFGLLIAVPATAILTTSYKAYRAELTLDFSDFQQPKRPKLRRGRKKKAAETSAPEATPKDTETPDASDT